MREIELSVDGLACNTDAVAFERCEQRIDFFFSFIRCKLV